MMDGADDGNPIPPGHVPGAPYPDAERVHEILRRFFPDADTYLRVAATMTEVPLIAANAGRSTPTFSIGQKLYVFDGYWGMNERVRVVGRFRQRHRWVRGVFPAASLTNCRPRIVYEPAVLRRLIEAWIPGGMFLGIAAVPVQFVPNGHLPYRDYYRTVLGFDPGSTSTESGL